MKSKEASRRAMVKRATKLRDVLYATIQFRNLQQLICCKIGLIRGW